MENKNYYITNNNESDHDIYGLKQFNYMILAVDSKNIEENDFPTIINDLFKTLDDNLIEHAQKLILEYPILILQKLKSNLHI
jgi:hypothetical protein